MKTIAERSMQRYGRHCILMLYRGAILLSCYPHRFFADGLGLHSSAVTGCNMTLVVWVCVLC